MLNFIQENANGRMRKSVCNELKEDKWHRVEISTNKWCVKCFKWLKNIPYNVVCYIEEQ